MTLPPRAQPSLKFAPAHDKDQSMKRNRFSEEQIIGIPKEHEAGVSVADLCRKHGVSDASIYKWKAKFGGMDVSEAKRLRTLACLCSLFVALSATSANPQIAMTTPDNFNSDNIARLPLLRCRSSVMVRVDQTFRHCSMRSTNCTACIAWRADSTGQKGGVLVVTPDVTPAA